MSGEAKLALACLDAMDAESFASFLENVVQELGVPDEDALDSPMWLLGGVADVPSCVAALRLASTVEMVHRDSGASSGHRYTGHQGVGATPLLDALRVRGVPQILADRSFFVYAPEQEDLDQVA